MKGQSNVEIARTPRNIFRYSVRIQTCAGRALIRLGAFTGYQTLTNSEWHRELAGSQRQGDNVLSREGNNPDHQLRSQIRTKLIKGGWDALTTRRLA